MDKRNRLGVDEVITVSSELLMRNLLEFDNKLRRFMGMCFITLARKVQDCRLRETRLNLDVKLFSLSSSCLSIMSK
jgi:hypothetical protein